MAVNMKCTFQELEQILEETTPANSNPLDGYDEVYPNIYIAYW
jgi:hypothetical protein